VAPGCTRRAAAVSWSTLGSAFQPEKDHCEKGCAECAGCARIISVEIEAARQLLHRTDRDEGEIAAELGLELRVDAERLDQSGIEVQRTAAQQKSDR